MTAEKDKLRVGVLFGGRSGEHEVSLMSARSILGALDRERYDVVEVGITLEGEWVVGDDVLQALLDRTAARAERATILPDPLDPALWTVQTAGAGLQLERLADLEVVFPVLHGPYGEDGVLQGLLELAGIAYVGAGVLCSAVGMDKGIFKDVMRAVDIPVLDSIVLTRSELESSPSGVVERAEQLAPYPLFTKPANLGSSVGITKCRSRSDLLEGLLEAAQYDRRILVERGIAGREIEVSVLGNEDVQVSIPGEIVPAGDFYTYESKYQDSRSTLLIPAPLSESRAAEVQDLAVRAFRAIDGAGLARVDFLLDTADERLYLNEVNTMPGFTQISMYPKLWEASGLPYSRLLDRLIDLALERKIERDRTRIRLDRKA